MMSTLIRLEDLLARGVVRCPKTLERWINAGKFPPGVQLQNRGHRVWTESQVNEWLAERGIPTEPAKTNAT